MKGSLNRELRAYFRRVRTLLPCGGHERRNILAGLKSSIKSYIEENPDAHMNGILEKFGAPEEIADTYIGDLSAGELRKTTAPGRKALRIFIAAVLIALIMWASVVISAYIKGQKQENGYRVISVQEVVDGETRTISEEVIP
ncbi:MAG: DUF6120 family protein [Oscillospiraceae bacterium]